MNERLSIRDNMHPCPANHSWPAAYTTRVAYKINYTANINNLNKIPGRKGTQYRDEEALGGEEGSGSIVPRP
jgi:hypothetical protein